MVNQVVNLRQFERFDAGQEIGVEYLKACGMISGRDPRVKILGNGEITAAFNVKVHAVSEQARKKIEAAGGTVELIPYGNEALVRREKGVKKARNQKKASDQE